MHLTRHPKLLLQLSRFGFAKSVPPFNKENANKINKMPLGEYFEDLMQRRLANASGYINLPKANFEAMVQRAKT